MSKDAIYAVLSAIPRGKVATYGQVAHLAGLGRGARIVGTTLKRLPADTQLPWHRVVNSQGKLSLPEGQSSHKLQKKRLQEEGVSFQRGRIDLNLYGWQG